MSLLDPVCPIPLNTIPQTLETKNREAKSLSNTTPPPQKEQLVFSIFALIDCFSSF